MGRTKKEWDLTILVITGGSIKGLAYVGALSLLVEKYDHTYLNKIPVMIGSSVGALIVTALQIGYSIDDLLQLFYQTDFKELFPHFFVNHTDKQLLKRLFSSFSIDTGKSYETWLKKMIDKKIDHTTLTFQKLYEKTGQELIIAASCMSTSKSVYFSKNTRPNMLIYDALRISSRIPFIVPPILLDNLYYCDGDVFEPFPIRGISKRYKKEIKKGNFLGIMSSKLEKTHIIESPLDYVKCLYVGIESQFIKFSVEKYKKHIIFIPLDINFDNISLSPQKLTELFEIGKKYGSIYFKKHGYPKPYPSYEPHKMLSKDLVPPVHEEQEDHQELVQTDQAS